MHSIVHESLSFIMPLAGDVFKVCSGTCKVLSQGDIIISANRVAHPHLLELQLESLRLLGGGKQIAGTMRYM